MKKEKFVLINLVKELIVRIDDNLTDFPKKELELKREIKSNSYGLLLDVYTANSTTDIVKRKDLSENILAKIKYIDFLINLCYDKSIINSKKYLKFGESLEYILKYTNGWINSN